MSDFLITIEPHSNEGFVLKTDLVIERPIEEVFAFFSDAQNLETITPPWLHFQIVTPTPINMNAGALIDYRLSLHGVPIKWRTKIESWTPPNRFTDQQLRGPYKRWFHEHTFESLGPNKTLAKDHVHYIPRFGSLVHKYFVKPDLIKIFTYRQEQLMRSFSSALMPKIDMHTSVGSSSVVAE